MEKVTNQHGDLLFVKVDAIPDGAKELKVQNGFVIERGEGVHTHVFEDVSGIQVFEKDGQTFVKVDVQTTVNHEEHGVQTLVPGTYKKRIERIWDYEAEEARKVQD